MSCLPFIRYSVLARYNVIVDVNKKAIRNKLPFFFRLDDRCAGWSFPIALPFDIDDTLEDMALEDIALEK